MRALVATGPGEHPSAQFPLVLGHEIVGRVAPAAGAAPVGLQAVMFRGLSMVGVRVYRPEDIDAAIAMLAAGAIDADAIITSVVPLDRVGAASAQLKDGTQVKVLVEGAAA